MPMTARNRLSPWPFFLAVSVTLTVFAVVLLLVSWQVRSQIRAQIMNRDASVLYPVVVHQVTEAKEDPYGLLALEESMAMRETRSSLTRPGRPPRGRYEREFHDLGLQHDPFYDLGLEGLTPPPPATGHAPEHTWDEDPIAGIGIGMDSGWARELAHEEEKPKMTVDGPTDPPSVRPDIVSDESLALLSAVLQASDFQGVVAVRLFDAEGAMLDAVPVSYVVGNLNGDDLTALQEFQPVTRYHPKALESDFFFDPINPAGAPQHQKAFPVLEVILPLHAEGAEEIAGVAQFLIDGQPLATEFARLDRTFWMQGLVAFITGAGIIGLVMGLSFQRLQRFHQLLAERSRRLARANHELALAAKTSAIGAVSAHLIHGLKNPLAGLQSYVSNLATEETVSGEGDAHEAAASARRMQSMIQEVVAVLQEEREGHSFDLTASEVMELVSSKLSAQAERLGVSWQCEEAPDIAIDSRRGNLVVLILTNLAQNAIEASPSGGSVEIQSYLDSGCLVWIVKDNGPGLPEHLRTDPFSVSQSTKPGGSGLGLAISGQLARHLGAELKLAQANAQGTCFYLRLALSPERRLGSNRIESYSTSV